MFIPSFLFKLCIFFLGNNVCFLLIISVFNDVARIIDHIKWEYIKTIVWQVISSPETNNFFWVHVEEEDEKHLLWNIEGEKHLDDVTSNLGSFSRTRTTTSPIINSTSSSLSMKSNPHLIKLRFCQTRLIIQKSQNKKKEHIKNLRYDCC